AAMGERAETAYNIRRRGGGFARLTPPATGRTLALGVTRLTPTVAPAAPAGPRGVRAAPPPLPPGARLVSVSPAARRHRCAGCDKTLPLRAGFRSRFARYRARPRGASPRKGGRRVVGRVSW